MFRGASPLLQRSVRAYAPVVKAIATAPPAIWGIDVDDYSEQNLDTIFDFAATLRRTLPMGASDVLVTKIMLGTPGCVPAFDSRFKRGFATGGFSRESLRRIGDFYAAQPELIDSYRVPTLDFRSGRPTRVRNPRAKVIDMIFFIEGAA